MSGSSFGFIDQNRWLTVAENGAPSFTGVQYNTSSQALPIPIIWGTRRISPQMIWVASVLDTITGNVFHAAPPGYNPGTDGGDFKIGPWLGAMIVGAGLTPVLFGSPDLSSSASTWFVPTIMALCEGPIDDVQRIWNGGGSAAMTWAEATDVTFHPPLMGIGSPLCPFYDKTYNGTSTQNPWAWWTVDPSILSPGGYPGQNLAYRFTALIYAPAMPWCHHTNTPPQQSFGAL